MTMTRRSLGAWTRLFPACLLAAVALTGGCMKVEFIKPAWPSWSSHKEPEGPPMGPVANITPLWHDGIVVRPDPAANGVPTPGFATKVYLHGPEGGDVQSEGRLTVQLYDDQQEPRNPPMPREQWIIDAPILKATLRKDAWGWYYNLWLPWQNYHPSISQVTLVLHHEEKTGQSVWSQPHYMTVQDHMGIRKPAQIQMTSFEKKPDGK
jgi:hypothetical protein